MKPPRSFLTIAVWTLVIILGIQDASAAAAVDMSRYSTSCGVTVARDDHLLKLEWGAGGSSSSMLVLSLEPGSPLIRNIVRWSGDKYSQMSFMERLDPVVFMTVGSRNNPPGRPPDMSIFNVFFDKPADRTNRTYTSEFALQEVRVASEGRRLHVEIGKLAIGPFAGHWEFTVYSGCPLVQVEAVVSTTEDRRAIIYDAGILTDRTAQGPAENIAWIDTEGRLIREKLDVMSSDRPIAARHRMIIAESSWVEGAGGGGSLVILPPPHQYQFPRDWTDNFKFNWLGRGHHGLTNRFGFGIRQDPKGGGAYVPWFNAPPGTEQRLGFFILPVRGHAEAAVKETLAYTRNDHFTPLPGHITFTTHYHIAMTMEALKQKTNGINPRPVPDFVRVFKEMGVNAVHLAEFHGDGHPKDPGPLRLPEMEMMFEECRRLSDGQFLLIPGEEGNEYLGVNEPGKHPGHWMSLFPKPVYWIERRKPEEPLMENHPKYGRLYRVGSREDMMELLRRENGLAWTAHPRIKASNWTPDIFRNEEFYLADYWLGAAWKAMPADLSRLRLGERCLNLLDDMANWGQRKHLPGEVDVFKIDHTHELFAHMNINYMRLNRLPGFDDGWEPVLKGLRTGAFFTTTGEVLVREFTVQGKQSGETAKAGAEVAIHAALDWTFPLRFAEIISGDGKSVFRHKIDLVDTGEFGKRMIDVRLDLRGRKWVRFEVWDIAVNGAFTQPVWLDL
jgi:hypothetical protein